MAVTFNYSPHPAQRVIHEARDVRFRTVCTGRRFGKTLCLAAELLDRGGSDPPSPGQAGGYGGTGKVRDYGWVAPTYNVAERGIEAFRTIADGFVKVVGRMPTRVEFAGPAGPVRVWFLSADNPDNIRGYGFQGLVVDEAAMIPQDVWNFVLRPTIAQTLGWAVFVSTPKGRNWFHDFYTRGCDPEEKDYSSFRFPSSASPFFPESEWEDAKRTLPSDVFRQEYEAEFLEDSAGVFRGIEGCLIRGDVTANGRELTRMGSGGRGSTTRPSPEATAGHADGRGRARTDMGDSVRGDVVVGCDVAKHTDFTVLIAMEATTGRCFAMDRFNQLDWPVQKERILDFVKGYRGRLILDATGVGDPIYDEIRRVYPDVEGFKLTASSKVSLIQRLIVGVEQQRVMWPGSWEVLTNEMKRYEYSISATGHLSYNAPSGYHDDCVIALALANHRRWEMESCGRMMRIAPRAAGDGRLQMGVGGRSRGGVRAERVLLG